MAQNPVFGIENPEYRIFVRKTKRYLERKNAIWSGFERCDAYVKITLEISEKIEKKYYIIVFFFNL